TRRPEFGFPAPNVSRGPSPGLITSGARSRPNSARIVTSSLAAAMTTDNRPPGRLRAAPVRGSLHIVLVEPEIPPNTGNIARLCAATRCPLHLVGKLGFRIDEHAVRRAGLDYWHLVSVEQHASLIAAETALGSADGREHRSWLFSG